MNRSWGELTMWISRVGLCACALLVLGGGGLDAQVAGDQADGESVGARVARLLGALAADSMEGRATGTAGSMRAARMIASALAEAGVDPGGDDGFFQTVDGVRVQRRGREGIVGRIAGPDGTFPVGEAVAERNVIGIVAGQDPELANQVIVVGAHYDHVGIGLPVDGDSIYNGADDDASGVVAVIEAARALAAGPAPRRTVVFVLFTGEEVGGLGSSWYLAHPAFPLDRTVAQLQIEMIGRPDQNAGGAGTLWATGFERSNVGELLAAEDVRVVADPYPDQNFFFRSDNVAFAMRGIPAHTLSSFNMHDDYHRPSDEVAGVDLDHLTAAVGAVIKSVRILADTDTVPAWRPGGRPEARRSR